jgi:hypothetical protein
MRSARATAARDLALILVLGHIVIAGSGARRALTYGRVKSRLISCTISSARRESGAMRRRTVSERVGA